MLGLLAPLGLALWLLSSAFDPCSAAAQPSPETSLPSATATESGPAARIEPGVWPTLGALGPGFFLRGTGTFLAHDRTAAKRLLTLGGVGFASFLGSGIVLIATGTSRRLVLPFTPLLGAGFALFITTWLADIYGAATGGRDDSVVEYTPLLETELGYRYVYDPQFAYRSFGHLRLDARRDRYRLSTFGDVALDDDNQRLGLELAYRLRGRRAEQLSADGSYLETTGAFLYHRYGSERFAVWTPTLTLDARLDLMHVGESLRGSFIEGQLGAGAELYAFDAPGSQPRDNAFGLLLIRFGFGLYFGQGRQHTGEAQLYYDHRHDDYAAGLAVRGIGGGVLGHVGLLGHYWFHRHFAASALLEFGSAVVAGLSLRHRWSPP